MSLVRMGVDSLQYQIVADDANEELESMQEVAQGFIKWLPTQVVVTVAAEDEVPVEVERLNSAPVEDWADWQDVVEFSMRTDHGRLYLWELSGTERRPNLAHRGPGVYRIRLSARNRDPDEASGAVREQQRLRVWPAPQAPPRLLKLTSAFAQQWGVEPAARLVDWDALSVTPGVRLLVHWWNLLPPADGRDADLVVVTSEEVLHLSPGRAFKAIDGMGQMAWAGASLGPGHMEIQMFDSKQTGHHPHHGALWLVRQQIDQQRFSSLRFRWGFKESHHWHGRDQSPPARSHPLPAESVHTTVTLRKHRDGRLANFTSAGVPAWLADDVSAFWRVIVDWHNDPNPRWHPWPWSEING